MHLIYVRVGGGEISYVDDKHIDLWVMTVIEQCFFMRINLTTDIAAQKNCTCWIEGAPKQINALLKIDSK